MADLLGLAPEAVADLARMAARLEATGREIEDALVAALGASGAGGVGRA
jgi:hypothetical protein